jgi:hypothetical protein
MAEPAAAGWIFFLEQHSAAVEEVPNILLDELAWVAELCRLACTRRLRAQQVGPAVVVDHLFHVQCCRMHGQSAVCSTYDQACNKGVAERCAQHLGAGAADLFGGIRDALAPYAP